MTTRRLARFAVPVLGVLAIAPWGRSAAAEGGSPCRAETVEGVRYTICRFDPTHDDLRLFWADASGEPYGSFKALDRDLGARGLRLRFAMNAGMYHPGLAPVGLFREEGREIRPLETRDAGGNFFLKPNGVFHFGAGKAGVTETSAFAAGAGQTAFATQSGPMLVIGGRLHPRFLPDSTSAKIRNGVGVTPAGEVVFAISEDRVTFHAFARLFRDKLGTPDALYLDGSISALHDAAAGRSDRTWPVGPIVAVVETVDP